MCEYIRYFCSTIAVNLLVLVAFIGIGNTYCVMKLHPVLNFFLLFSALTLLAYVEALHYGCVAIETWNLEHKKEEYPRLYMTQKLVNTTEKVKRFLVGRQFFVIFVVFLIAQITVFPDMPHNFAGMPSTMVTVLVETGLPGVALVLTYGQLISQLFVEEFTMPFMDIVGCYSVTQLGLGAEYIGICHFSHLLFKIAANMFFSDVIKAQKTIDSSTDLIAREGGVAEASSTSPPPPSIESEGYSAWDIFRYAWSTCVTLGAVGVTLTGIGQGHYILPTPIAATYIIFGITMTILFYLEGLMIALVATQYWDKETFKEAYPSAWACHELVNRPDNMKRFIIGRQFFTVLVVFLIAQCSTFPEWPSGNVDPTLFWICIKSGLVGVFVVLAFGQLLPELLAAQYPLRFMNLPGSFFIVRCSMFFDAVGVGHAAWLVRIVTKTNVPLMLSDNNPSFRTSLRSTTLSVRTSATSKWTPLHTKRSPQSCVCLPRSSLRQPAHLSDTRQHLASLVRSRCGDTHRHDSLVGRWSPTEVSRQEQESGENHTPIAHAIRMIFAFVSLTKCHHRPTRSTRK